MSDRSWIFMLMAQMTWTHARMCLLGFCQYGYSHKNPIGAWIGVFQPFTIYSTTCLRFVLLTDTQRVKRCIIIIIIIHAKYWNLHLFETTTSIVTKFCTVMETTKYSSWVQCFVKIGQTVYEISRFFYFQDGRRPPSWILKILNFWLTFNWVA